MAYLHLNVSDGLDFESLIQFLIKVLFSLFLNLNKTPGIIFFFTKLSLRHRYLIS